jgi:hypothetical protein
VVRVLSESREPMTSGEIIAAARGLSGGAAASVRTQIIAARKAGEIRQVPHSGRGHKYAAV